MAKPKTMPKTVFIYEMKDRDASWFNVETSPADCAGERGDGARLVGRYELVETLKVSAVAKIEKA